MSIPKRGARDWTYLEGHHSHDLANTATSCRLCKLCSRGQMLRITGRQKRPHVASEDHLQACSLDGMSELESLAQAPLLIGICPELHRPPNSFPDMEHCCGILQRLQAPDLMVHNTSHVFTLGSIVCLVAVVYDKVWRTESDSMVALLPKELYSY